MSVKTSTDLTGLAPADSRWRAYDEAVYDGAIDAGEQTVGYGATEVEAVLDLVAKIIEHEPEHPSHGMGGGLMREAQLATCQRLAEAVRELAP